MNLFSSWRTKIWLALTTMSGATEFGIAIYPPVKSYRTGSGEATAWGPMVG